MKVTFPHMGMLYVPMQVLLRAVGAEPVVPPFCSGRSLALAARHSPEFVCVPYKLVLGNLIEGIEMGANAAIMLGGPNNCRFGYYSILQKQVLQQMGYQCEYLTPQISSRTISGVIDVLKHIAGRPLSTWECVRIILLALSVLSGIDEIERKVQWVRAREEQTGTASKAFQEAATALAQVDSPARLKEVKRHYLEVLEKVPVRNGQDHLRVELVGEVYVVHEPYINMNLEEELGRQGIEVRRSEMLSQWLVVSPALILEALGVGHEARIARAARPYLEYLHGETIGQTVMASRAHADGVIHLTPFTCTPEIVNQNVLLRLRQDVDIPVITLVLDEHTGKAGVQTRLEAFVDLLQRRRQRALAVRPQKAREAQTYG